MKAIITNKPQIAENDYNTLDLSKRTLWQYFIIYAVLCYKNRSAMVSEIYNKSITI
jgi:hypothetical protein